MKSFPDKLAALTPVPEGAPFKLLEVREQCIPHPYCITPKHLQHADSMYLNAESIERAEKKGARCDICAHSGRPILPYSEHKIEVFAFIEVPKGRDLNDIPGLHTYLLSIKERAEQLSITGFAFPSPKADSEATAAAQRLTASMTPTKHK